MFSRAYQLARNALAAIYAWWTDLLDSICFAILGFVEFEDDDTED